MVQLLLVLATVGAAAMAHGQNQSSIAQDASGQGSKNATQSPSSAVRILRPSPGQTLANNFVTLHFELVRPNPAGSDHNFVIQLDGLDPVNTSETEYTFTVIRSGKHTVAVMEVDANGTPLPDARAEVQFTVKPPEGSAPSAQNGRNVTPSKQ